MVTGLIMIGYHRMFDSRKIASTSSAPGHSDSLQEAVMSGFVIESLSAVMLRMFSLHVRSLTYLTPLYGTSSKLIYRSYTSWWPRHSLRLPRCSLPILASSPSHPPTILRQPLPHPQNQSPRNPLILVPRTQATTNPLPRRHNRQRQGRNRAQPAQDLPPRLVPLYSLVYTKFPARSESRAEERGHDPV